MTYIASGPLPTPPSLHPPRTSSQQSIPVRPLTPLLTREDTFAFANALRREERDQRAREERLSATKTTPKSARYTVRPSRARKSNVAHTPTPPHTNQTLVNMLAVALSGSDDEGTDSTLKSNADEGTDSDGYNPSKPLYAFLLLLGLQTHNLSSTA